MQSSLYNKCNGCKLGHFLTFSSVLLVSLTIHTLYYIILIIKDVYFACYSAIRQDWSLHFVLFRVYGILLLVYFFYETLESTYQNFLGRNKIKPIGIFIVITLNF